MISALKGMKDLLNIEARLYERVIKACESVARNYGFEFIATPHLELSALFKRSVGESSDIVGKEMYEFIDKGENSVCLRPEGTAGVVRAYIEHKFDKTQSVKRWFYHGSMFRYERPQKGRLREFHQFGVESFGVKSVFEDATLILMLAQILAKLGIKAKLKLNSLGCEKCLPEFRAKFLEFVSAKSGFCEDCKRRKELNPIRMLDCKNEHCQDLLVGAPALKECLCAECRSDFESLQGLLSANGVEFELDDKLVRGLDYYSKTAFEFESDEIGAKAAVAGGGRYDKLISYLGGKEGFGVGFAIGVERLMAILAQKEQNNDERDGIYLCALKEKYLERLFTFATDLRKAGNKVFLSYLHNKKPRWHLDNADLKKAQIFLCFGEDEVDKGTIYNSIKILGQPQNSTKDIVQTIEQLEQSISQTKLVKVLEDLKNLENEL